MATPVVRYTFDVMVVFLVFLQHITPPLNKQDLISRVTQEDVDILPFHIL